jgi:hypothetical protein
MHYYNDVNVGFELSLHGLGHTLFTSCFTGEEKAKIPKESGSPLLGMKTIVHTIEN